MLALRWGRKADQVVAVQVHIARRSTKGRDRVDGDAAVEVGDVRCGQRAEAQVRTAIVHPQHLGRRAAVDRIEEPRVLQPREIDGVVCDLRRGHGVVRQLRRRDVEVDDLRCARRQPLALLELGRGDVGVQDLHRGHGAALQHACGDALVSKHSLVEEPSPPEVQDAQDIPAPRRVTHEVQRGVRCASGDRVVTDRHLEDSVEAHDKHLCLCVGEVGQCKCVGRAIPSELKGLRHAGHTELSNVIDVLLGGRLLVVLRVLDTIDLLVRPGASCVVGARARVVGQEALIRVGLVDRVRAGARRGDPRDLLALCVPGRERVAVRQVRRGRSATAGRLFEGLLRDVEELERRGVQLVLGQHSRVREVDQAIRAAPRRRSDQLDRDSRSRRGSEVHGRRVDRVARGLLDIVKVDQDARRRDSRDHRVGQVVEGDRERSLGPVTCVT